MENTGIWNNEYQIILKIKKNIKNQIIFNMSIHTKVENNSQIGYKYIILEANKKVSG